MVTQMIYHYDHSRYPKAHMPYAIMDLGRLRQFGCIQIEGRWKVHELVDGEWHRIETGLPEDATECSPFAFYDADREQVGLTFIGGASAESMPFRMHRCANVDSPEFREVVRCSVGYQWKRMTVHGDGSGVFDIDYEEGWRRRIAIEGVRYIYRITSDYEAPWRVLASCQLEDDSIHTYGIDTVLGNCEELVADGLPTYKPCICAGQCAYAVKNGEDFEDRSIESTLNWRYEQVMDNPVRMTDEMAAEEG